MVKLIGGLAVLALGGIGCAYSVVALMTGMGWETWRVFYELACGGIPFLRVFGILLCASNPIFWPFLPLALKHGSPLDFSISSCDMAMTALWVGSGVLAAVGIILVANSGKAKSKIKEAV